MRKYGRSRRKSMTSSKATRTITTRYFKLPYPPWEDAARFPMAALTSGPALRCLAIAVTAALRPGIWQIVFATARKGIVVTAARRRRVSAPIDTSRRQRASMNCLGENPGNLLRQRAMLGRCSTAERLFQLVGYISADEYSFAIGHLSGVSL